MRFIICNRDEPHLLASSTAQRRSSAAKRECMASSRLIHLSSFYVHERSVKMVSTGFDIL
jgi:hypothetical protein